MGPIRAKRGQNEVLGHLHVQNALVLANFAYYDRELGYLVGIADQCAKWFFVGPKMGPIRAKRGQNEVLGHFLVQNSFVLADFAYYDWE